MSVWKDFLDSVFGDADKPGKVMICFVNRYLEGMDDVRYKIKYDGLEKSGTTTAQNYCVELPPKSLDPIQTFVWSRKAMAYKKLDDVTPVKGRKKLVRKVMKTFKVPAKTSLSEILCLRHSMTNRSIYAKQEEAGGSRHDGVAVDPQGTH